MLRKQTDNGQPFHGNDRFEGYCADLAEAVSKIVKFKYVLKPVEDKKYGSLTNGKWDGMIGELTGEVGIHPIIYIILYHCDDVTV